jgi:hypothetical protein
MKKIFILFTFFIVVFTLHAGEIIKTYRVASPTSSEKGSYQLIGFENMLLTGKTGEPTLPYMSVKLLLPPGEVAVSIDFSGEEETLIPGQFLLFPQQASRPLSDESQYKFIKNEKIYNSDASYPASQTGHLNTGYLNGYAIAMSTFTPLRYKPVSGEISYFKKVTLKITTEPSAKSSTAIANLKSDGNTVNRIMHFVQNPEDLEIYPTVSESIDNYKLLIVTSAQYENDFQDLTDMYIQRGIKSEVVTKEYIDNNGTGQDIAEKVRNYIIDEYQNHSIEYVLLGGDIDQVPYRGFYCYAQSGDGYYDYNIPADLYFSALDGTWNDNNNNKWGEPGEDDLLPEIGIARFSFNNTSELGNLIHKSISYQNSPVPGEFNKALMAGEWLYDNPETWGSDYLEMVIGDQTDNGYETIGVPETYDFEKLYDENGSWSASDLRAAINSGQQYVHHCGHANSTYVARMDNSDITNANFSGANGVDHNYTIFHSHGCDCGAFDDNDCIMEKMASIANFAVAVIGNSRYGWFNEGQTEGPSAHLHREMMNALYHEKINHIGAAFTQAKIETAPWVTAPGQWEEGALRWNFYDINIFGDPTLAIWTAEPISIETTYDNEIPADEYSTSVTVSANGEPAVNFTCAILMDSIIYGTATTDESGEATIIFDSEFPHTGTAQLVVTGYNCLPTVYELTITISTGVKENNEMNFGVYPNPATAHFSVNYKLKKETDTRIVLLNSLGQEVKELIPAQKQAAGNYKVDFSRNGLTPGVYFIRNESGNRFSVKKLLITD